MTVRMDTITVVNNTMKITWRSLSRVATVHFSPVKSLSGEDGTFLTSTLASWIGESAEPFGLIADTKEVRGTDADYRAETRRFFGLHHDTVHIALMNTGPVILVVAEMLRIATGIQLKTFRDEESALIWFRLKGIPA